MPDATLMIVRDGNGERIVVDQADDEIWLAPELWAEICDPNRKRIPGDAETDGELLTFGTPGEGEGRLTYRRTADVYDYGQHFIAFTREKP